jgi:hypothetical protein
VNPVALVGIAALAFSFQAGGWTTAPAAAMTPASAPTSAFTLTVDNHPGALEQGLGRLRDSTSLPDHPDREWVDKWLHESHLDRWKT